MPRLICPLCPPERTINLNMNLTDYLKHVQLFHSHQPGFSITCGLDGCLRSFSSFRSFRNHVYSYHGGDSSLELQQDGGDVHNDPTRAGGDDGEDEDGADGDGDTDTTWEMSGTCIQPSQRNAAMFLMGLKEKHMITQAALQGVIEGVTNLMQSQLDALHSQVHQQLLQSGVSQAAVDGLQPLFSRDGIFGRPFQGLETQYQQLKFYRQHFNLVEPTRICLGERRVWKGSGLKRRCVAKKDEMFYVSVIDTLHTLLQRDHFLDKINSVHYSGSDTLEDFCDGKVYHSHPLFSLQSNALQVFFYFDDLEVCNPLGSRRKIHKISIFYFTLGNVQPKYRSKLSTIQLVAIVKHKHLSMYGMDAVLRPFVDDIKKLEKGFAFTIQGTQKVLFGTLAAISADNLGSLALGGFKESCTAYRCCRHCMATRDMMSSKFREEEFELRTKAAHITHCDEISSGRADASRDYGVNRDSILNELSYFHVCEGGLLPDIMHDLLEGALQYEVKVMLLEMITQEHYFSVDVLNSRLATIELGYMETKDRPTPLDEHKISNSGHTLNQSAAQMWLLARILPLVVGELVPEEDERWMNYLRMMEIVDILFSPRITEDDAAYLAALVCDHHEQFQLLYPGWSIIPKMHFMVHMPRLMIEYGPLVRHWTMRYEAKHAYFKTLAQSMGNFINIPYSLAMRHQQLQCYNSCAQEQANLTVGPGSAVVAAVLEAELEIPVASAYESKWVIIDGVEFKRGAGVVYAVADDLPQILLIDTIQVINGSTVVLKGSCFSTSYSSHFHCYKLHSLRNDAFFFHQQLSLHLPVHVRKPRCFPHDNVVIMPFSIINY